MKVTGIDYDSRAVHLATLDNGKLVSLLRVHLPGATLTTAIESIASQIRIGLPDAIFIEAPIYIQNPKTSFKLTRVHVLICVACEQTKLPYQVIEPTRWKKLAMGTARINKHGVFEAIRSQFGEAITDSHYADAVAMSIAGQKILEEEKNA